jgi:LysM repeat protein
MFFGLIKHLVMTLLAVSLCGCAALQQQRRDAMRQHSDIESLKLDVSRLKDRLDGIEAAQESLHGEISELRGSQAKDNDRLQERLAEIDRKVDLMDRARDKLRQDIVDTLSSKIAEVMQKQASASRVRVEEGYEHVVKPGETLSQIAAAYGASIDLIIKANNIRKPDEIRAGQKLFIPE